LQRSGGAAFQTANPEFQVELRSAVGRLDAYVLANGKDMSSAKIDEFKSRQGGVGVPLQRLCSGDGVELYNAFEKRGARELRKMIDSVVERPGPPTWGTCL